MNKISNAIIILIIMLNLAFDQVSKIIVRNEVSNYEIIKLFGNWFTLTKVENIGAFLSAGSALPDLIRIILLSVFPIIFLAYGLYMVMVKRNMSNLQIVGWCFVIGGGSGNLFDRIVHGSVTDFLHLDLGLFQTGIFNLADVSIMIGMFIILTGQFFYKKEESLTLQ
ncbi:MAG: signal peptidase II [Pedobacter sp.]|nr:signal peptidase II [Pedobacter sp.]